MYYADIIRLSSLILIWKWQTFCAVFAVSFPESKTDSNPNLKKECIQSTMLPSARRASSFVHCKKKLSRDTNHKRKRGSGSELKHPGSSTLIVWNYSDYYGFWLLIHKVSCDRAGMANECGYTRACILVELTISCRNHFAVNQKCQFSPSLAPEPKTRIHEGRMRGKIRKIFFMICSTV